LRSLESHLVGRSPHEVETAVIAEHLSSLSPIDDVRATAGYRLEAASVLVRRALESCGGDR
jgi:CO/xanthine dehydrogenase FAD-binding subunit